MSDPSIYNPKGPEVDPKHRKIAALRNRGMTKKFRPDGTAILIDKQTGEMFDEHLRPVEE